MMVKHFIKISFRSIVRYKFYSISIVLGYSLAFTFCFLIIIFLTHERSADKFNLKYDRISRLLMSNIFGDMSVSTFPESITYIKSNFPEVEDGTFIKWIGKVKFDYGAKSFVEDKGLLADSSFLKIFDYELLAGNRSTCLTSPNSIVITKTFSRKYFGDELPLGYTIYWDSLNLQVTAVLDDIPSNSHMDFDFLVSRTTIPRTEDVSLSTATYLLLTNNISNESFESKLNNNRKNLVNIDNDFIFKIQPLSQAYFHQDFIYGYFGNIFKSRSKDMLLNFGIIAFIIVIVTNFNFISFSQANSIYRTKEVLVNRIFGISSIQSLMHFVIESTIILFGASLISFILVSALLPTLNRLTDSEISFEILANEEIWIKLFFIVALCSLFLGVINYSMSQRMNSSELLKRFKAGAKLSKISQSLTVIQISVSVVLCTLMTTMVEQIQFIRNLDTGYYVENIVEISLDNIPLNTNPQVFKNEILKSSNVISASVCTGNPITGRGFYNEKLNGSDVSIGTLSGDDGYIPTLGFKLLSGRNFNPLLQSDTMSVVVNERAAQMFKLKIDSVFGSLKVVGIVRDFHFGSLHEKINPVIIYYSPYQRFYNSSLKLVVYANGNTQKVIEEIGNKWSSHYGKIPFQYNMLADVSNRLHMKDHREVYLLSLSAIGAIMIATFGLSGLGYFVTRKKTKEIAIRKIHGASSSGIASKFILKVVYAVIIGSLLAFPAGNYLSNEWLSNYVYRIEESKLYFLIAVAFSMIISTLSVMYPVVIASRNNPILALHND